MDSSCGAGAATPSIADPFLQRKIDEGRIDDIREWIGCNICVTGDMTMSISRCTQNPTIMKEWRSRNDQVYHDRLARQADWADAGVLSVKRFSDAEARARFHGRPMPATATPANWTQRGRMHTGTNDGENQFRPALRWIGQPKAKTCWIVAKTGVTSRWITPADCKNQNRFPYSP